MSTPDYSNQEALNKALNIYRTCMRGFIILHLRQIPGTTVEDVVIESVSDWRADAIDSALNAGKDIKSIIDIDDFPLLVTRNWENIFKQPLDDDKGFGNQLWLIKDCRDQSWAHPDEGAADSEGTRAYFFLIAEVLRKIKSSDKQREVEAIRDELFSDDTVERLEKAEKDSAEYKKSLAEAEKRLASVASEKNEYKEKNAVLLQDIGEKEKQRKKLDRQVKSAKERHNKLKSDVAGVEKRLEESEAAQAGYKKRLETTDERLKETESELAIVLDQLAAVQAENKDIMTRLAAMPDLFTTATLTSEIRPIFPTFDTDSSVRILDRRGTDKQNYLSNLLEQKRPTLIYVQSKEKVNQLLTDVLPEKAGVIEKFYETMTEAEEKEILEKLENDELTAVVSNATFSALTSSHPFEHFVFCHLVPSLDIFCERCQPAFTSTRNVYLHLIYESKQNIEGCPKDETIRELYKELQKLAEANDDFINYENIYDALNMKKLEVETGLVILEELQYLEQKKMGIKLLQSSGKQLEESVTYYNGKRLREEAENSPAFQYEQSIEQIWESISEKVNVDNELILRENNISTKLEEITVEPLTESVEGIYETAASEFVTVLEPQGAVSQVREPRLSIADRYVKETTEADRDKLAVQIAVLRINTTGSRPLAWKTIRAEFGLKEDEFHKVIRLSPGYRKAVIDRIKSLKVQEGGWEYSGKLASLTGIDDISEDELK
ncbi:MAG: hypothetical protein OXN25_02820 [Candidatus Poribacteria bacterium]|nr:hypothetical protein [Candidatus Poribacteria bacterium]